MKTPLFKSITLIIPSAIAIFCMVILASSIQPEKKAETSVAATPCCNGYNIPLNRLRQFMLDSLKTGAFEGGIYSKKDLLEAINSTNGDSLYIMNGLLNCLLNEGNGMIIASQATGELKIISRNPYCSPCPQRACCPQKICATRINRSCLRYKNPYGFDAATEDFDASDVSVSK